MNAIAGVVSASLDLHEIMEAALDKVLELMSMDGGTAYRLSAAGETLILTARRGRASRDLPVAAPAIEHDQQSRRAGAGASCCRCRAARK